MTIENEWMRLTAAELNARAEAGALVIVPVASMEQHGPHLATGVDILTATAVSQRVAAHLGADAVVTPCIWTGLAEHHMAFGGTVTLDYQAFFGVIRGVVRSAARCGFRRVMLLNGHGGNAEAVAVAGSELTIELGIPVAAATYWHVLGDALAPVLEAQSNVMHACEAETSMIMALAPSCVRPERLAEAHGPMSTRVEGQHPNLFRRKSFRDITPSGVVGDARSASAEKGEKLLTIAAQRIADMLRNEKLW